MGVVAKGGAARRQHALQVGQVRAHDVGLEVHLESKQ
jgi:hypothetical protein